jgi:hypothetical protein
MPNPFHTLAHKLGTNTGQVTTWRESGSLMVGFRCVVCDEIMDAHAMPSFPELEAALARRRSETQEMAQP